MKRKLFYFLFAVFSLTLVLSSCKYSKTKQDEHIHTYNTSWTYDDSYHWHASTCGHDSIVTKIAHDFDVEVTVPTCITRGYTTHTCKDCGYSYKDAYVNALGHSYSQDWTYDSTYHWHASTCDHNEKGNNAKHNFIVETINPTCLEQGYTLHTCSVCNYSYKDTYVNALGHTYSEDYSYDSTYHWYASTCDHDVVKEKEEHDYNDVVKAPTCDSQGYTTHTCKDCGYEYKDTYVNATGHTYSEDYSNDETYHWHDSTCGHNVTNGKAVHDYNDVVTAPTCTEQGYTTHTCKDCGYEYKDTYVNATGHTYSEDWTYNEGSHWHDATCTHTGNKSNVESHDYKEKEVIAATCEHDGYTVYECKVCGYTYNGNNVSKLAHVVENWNETSRVLKTGCSCTYIVSYSGTCKDCKATCNRQEEVVSHDLHTVIELEATCMKNGVKKTYCSNDDCQYHTTPYKTENYQASGDGDYHHWVKDNSLSTEDYEYYYCDNEDDEHHQCSATKKIINSTNKSASVTSSQVDEVNEIALKNEDKEISIGLDSGIKENITNQAGSNNVSFTADVLTQNEIDAAKESLSEADKQKLGTNPVVYNFTIQAGSNTVSDLGGTATIRIKYELGDNDPNNIIVWYISEGSLTPIQATYANGYVTFTTTHFSDYTVSEIAPEQYCEYYEVHGETQVVLPTCTTGGYTVCLRCGKVIATTPATGHSFESQETTVVYCETNGLLTYTCKICHESYTEVIKALGHDYVEIDRVNSTCKEEGYIEYECSRCHEIHKQYLPLLEHDFEHEVIDPTCIAKGYTLHTCIVCHESYKDSFVAATGHNETIVNAKAVTCEEDGYTAGVWCDVCKAYISGHDVIKATGHDYVKVVVKPTCETKGYTTYTCSKCNHSYVDDYVEKLEHVYNIVSANPTCETRGYTTYTCTLCEKTHTDYVDALGHDYSEEYSTNENGHYHICNNCGGFSEIESHVKDYENATTEHGVHCSICGYEIETAINHVHGESVTKVKQVRATCEESGNIEYYICSCNEYFYDEGCNLAIINKNLVVVAALNHKYENKYYENEEGHYHICENCGKHDEVIEHEFEETVVNPTCEKQGYTTHTCSVCGYTYKDNYVDPLGHSFSEEWSYNATHHWNESTCGHDVVNSKEEHDYNDIVTVPTCTDQGYTTHTCSVCGYSYIDTYVDATGHTFNGYVSYETDKHAHYCESCKQYFDIELCHGGQATCQGKAICEVCGNEYGEVGTHHFVDGECEYCHQQECYVGTLNFEVFEMGVWDVTLNKDYTALIVYQGQEMEYTWSEDEDAIVLNLDDELFLFKLSADNYHLEAYFVEGNNLTYSSQIQYGEYSLYVWLYDDNTMFIADEDKTFSAAGTYTEDNSYITFGDSFFANMLGTMVYGYNEGSLVQVDTTIVVYEGKINLEFEEGEIVDVVFRLNGQAEIAEYDSIVSWHKDGDAIVLETDDGSLYFEVSDDGYNLKAYIPSKTLVYSGTITYEECLFYVYLYEDYSLIIADEYKYCSDGGNWSQVDSTRVILNNPIYYNNALYEIVDGNFVENNDFYGVIQFKIHYANIFTGEEISSENIVYGENIPAFITTYESESRYYVHIKYSYDGINYNTFASFDALAHEHFIISVYQENGRMKFLRRSINRFNTESNELGEVCLFDDGTASYQYNNYQTTYTVEDNIICLKNVQKGIGDIYLIKNEERSENYQYYLEAYIPEGQVMCSYVNDGKKDLSMYLFENGYAVCNVYGIKYTVKYSLEENNDGYIINISNYFISSILNGITYVSEANGWVDGGSLDKQIASINCIYSRTVVGEDASNTIRFNVCYDDGSTEIVGLNKVTIVSGSIDYNTVGSYEMTISYNDFEYTFTFKVGNSNDLIEVIVDLDDYALLLDNNNLSGNLGTIIFRYFDGRQVEESLTSENILDEDKAILLAGVVGNEYEITLEYVDINSNPITMTVLLIDNNYLENNYINYFVNAHELYYLIGENEFVNPLGDTPSIHYFFDSTSGITYDYSKNLTPSDLSGAYKTTPGDYNEEGFVIHSYSLDQLDKDIKVVYIDGVSGTYSILELNQNDSIETYIDNLVDEINNDDKRGLAIWYDKNGMLLKDIFISTVTKEMFNYSQVDTSFGGYYKILVTYENEVFELMIHVVGANEFTLSEYNLFYEEFAFEDNGKCYSYKVYIGNYYKEYTWSWIEENRIIMINMQGSNLIYSTQGESLDRYVPDGNILYKYVVNSASYEIDLYDNNYIYITGGNKSITATYELIQNEIVVGDIVEQFSFPKTVSVLTGWQSDSFNPVECSIDAFGDVILNINGTLEIVSSGMTGTFAYGDNHFEVNINGNIYYFEITDEENNVLSSFEPNSTMMFEYVNGDSFVKYYTNYFVYAYDSLEDKYYTSTFSPMPYGTKYIVDIDNDEITTLMNGINTYDFAELEWVNAND